MRWVYAILISTSIGVEDPKSRYVSKTLQHTHEASITLGKPQKNGFWNIRHKFMFASLHHLKKEDCVKLWNIGRI